VATCALHCSTWTGASYLPQGEHQQLYPHELKLLNSMVPEPF
jgi:hypothetical protein